MKLKRALIQSLSVILVLAMTLVYFPLGAASVAGGSILPPAATTMTPPIVPPMTPPIAPDRQSGGRGNDEALPGEVLAPADSLEHAQTIAEAYGLELKSFAYGIAVLDAPDPEQVVAQSGKTRGIPKLSLNRLYHTCEPSTVDSRQKAIYILPETTYDPYITAADKEKKPRRPFFDEPDDPDDPYYPGQWHRAEMDIDRAWSLSTGSNAIIAVIDTGIDIDHPAFAGRISEVSYNTYTDKIGLENVRDDWGHGTHVSGIAAASMDVVANVCGVAPDAVLLVIKANEPGFGYFWSVDLCRAINYAAQNGADVINMSLSRDYFDGESYDELEHQVIANAVANGVTVVCAAGNSNDKHAGYPAAYPESIAVSSTRQGFKFDNWYSTSNHGPEVDISAPGGQINSTVMGGGYDIWSGTSMAAPNVAGVVALIKELHPEYTPQQIRSVLCETARDAGDIGRDDYFGYGIVNAYAAVLGSDALYDVTFDFNDGSRTPVTIKVIPGETLLVPYDPQRDEYAFEGWYITGSEEEFDFSGPVNQNIILIAKWLEALGGMYILEFPDVNFRREVKRLLSEQYGRQRRDSNFVENDTDLLASIDYLYTSGMSIYDMTGIKFFTGLTGFACEYNYLKTLDVSKNTTLLDLWCANNELVELNLSKNTMLVALWCADNELIELDVSKNVDLQMLDCSDNYLPELDLSKNDRLFWLNCSRNEFTELDFSACTALETLYSIQNFQLSSLNVTNNTLLKSLHCLGCKLTELDVTNNTELEILSCSENLLTELDVSKNTKLSGYNEGMFVYPGLDCSYNQLKTLNISKNTELKILICHSNQFTELDLSYNTDLEELFCGHNSLTTLDLSKNTKLEHLGCSGNELTALDVSKNTALTFIGCSENYLTALDVSKNDDLLFINCYNNRLTMLDVSDKAVLEGLDCRKNLLTELDAANADLSGSMGWWYVSGYELYSAGLQCSDNRLAVLDVSETTGLRYMDCSYNLLTGLDISFNVELVRLDSTYNYIASIDNVIGWEVIPGLMLYNSFWFYPQLSGVPPTGKDITDTFKDPGFLAAVREMIGKPSGPIIDYDVAKIREVRVSKWDTENTIYDLSGIENFNSLVNLSCYGQQLTELDISKNTALESLDCYSNKLLSLNVSSNIMLGYLSCEGNLLTELNLSSNTWLWLLNCSANRFLTLPTLPEGLRYLYCYSNQFTSLPVLPENLYTLNCQDNMLTTLPMLPESLETLSCDSNQLTTLPELPNGLWYLYCGYNMIESLPVLPSSLKWLICNENSLTGIDVTGLTLEYFNCSFNYIPAPSDIIGFPIEQWDDDYYTFYPQKGPYTTYCISGIVRSYNPKVRAIIRLMQGDYVMDTVITEYMPGSGQVEQPFKFTDVEPGTYEIFIEKKAHATFTVQSIIVVNKDIDLTQDNRPEVRLMTLRCGDINGDGLINDSDLTVLWMLENYNRKASDAEEPLCDLNGDGMINDQDLTILWMAYNYNQGPVIIRNGPN